MGKGQFWGGTRTGPDTPTQGRIYKKKPGAAKNTMHIDALAVGGAGVHDGLRGRGRAVPQTDDVVALPRVEKLTLSAAQLHRGAVGHGGGEAKPQRAVVCAQGGW